MRWGPLKLVGVVNLLLVGVLVALWVDEHGQIRNTRWAAPVAVLPDFSRPIGLADTAKLAANPIHYLAILERPMFAPDRKPPPPPAPPPPPDPMADIQISAIFTGEHSGVLARVEGRSRRVKVTEGIGAWTLKSVEGRKATFVSGDETRELDMAYSKFGAPSPPPAAVAGASAGGGAAAAPTNMQDEARERLRRRNAMRAERGLPPVTD